MCDFRRFGIRSHVIQKKNQNKVLPLSHHVQQQLTRGLDVGRTATEEYEHRRIPCAGQHVPGACTAATAAAAVAKETGDQPLLLDANEDYCRFSQRLHGLRESS